MKSFNVKYERTLSIHFSTLFRRSDKEGNDCIVVNATIDRKHCHFIFMLHDISKWELISYNNIRFFKEFKDDSNFRNVVETKICGYLAKVSTGKMKNQIANNTYSICDNFILKKNVG